MEQSSIICPNCQTPNPARNLYCQSCGKPLVQAPQGPPAPPAGEEMMTNQTVVQKPVDPQPPFPMPPYPPAGQPVPPQGPTIASQGYPPQEIPPQGYPQQGYPQQGYPPQQQQGYPPQQGYYPPPAPAPSPRPPAAPKLEQLGVRVDGWSALIPSAGDQAQAVQTAFVVSFNAREIPMVRLDPVDYTTAGLKKTYWVAQTPSESTAVQIEAKGKDLFLNWSQYVKRTLEWRMIGILVAIAFAISFFTSLSLVRSFGYFLLDWIFGTFNWLLPVAVIALVAGYFYKGSFWYFFMPEADEMRKDDRTALMLAVHQSLLEAVEKAGLDPEPLGNKSFRVRSRDRKI